MHDKLFILRNGQVHEGRRYMRKAGGRTYQTVFYVRLTRCDPVGYARFSTDDPAMNAAAEAMLGAMVDEAVRVVEESQGRRRVGGNGRVH